jgi:hypothetical protein
VVSPAYPYEKYPDDVSKVTRVNVLGLKVPGSAFWVLGCTRLNTLVVLVLLVELV